MFIRDLQSEFERLESKEVVNSAQATTAILHKDWLDIKSADIGVQKNLSNLFSSGRTQREKLESEKKLQAHEAFKKYHKQGEPRKSDHQADLTRFARFDLSSYNTSATTKPRTTPQLNPGPSSGQTNVVRLGLD